MRNKKITWSLFAFAMVVFYTSGTVINWLIDYLWFETIGYTSVFLRIFSAKLLIGVASGSVAALFLFVNLLLCLNRLGHLSSIIPADLRDTPLVRLLDKRLLRKTLLGISALFGLASGAAMASSWQEIMLYFYSEPFGYQDPVFGRDASFYIFSLPFLKNLQSFAWSITFFPMLICGLIYFFKAQSTLPSSKEPFGKGNGSNVLIRSFPPKGANHLGGLGVCLLLIIAFGLLLSRFELMHEKGGLFTGPGYADIHATLPFLSLKAAVMAIAAVLLTLWTVRGGRGLLFGIGGLLVTAWVGGNIYTNVLQRFVVAPNELEKERTFLAHHIEATNYAFGLSQAVERTLDKKERPLTALDIARNRPTIDNIRLWDHEPLLSTFSQIQEIRTYYDFVSVDNDRYMINGALRQIMLSPRELNPLALPSRTWVNERLTFTHGYGITSGPVNQFNEQGLPNLYVQDLPPKSSVDAFKIDHPEIYYGEVASNYVFVRTRHDEFNYPQGDANIFSRYEGKGGVPITGFWRKLLFSLGLRDLKMLLSDDFTEETRVLLYRNIYQRIQKVMPFFRYDRDPYMVAVNGRLTWIQDAYTFSDRFPYAEQLPSLGNYMRNPIKVLVDAKDGSIKFFSKENEPIAKAYARLFPGVIRPIETIDSNIRAHLRHPVDLFSVQTQVYATYHMRDVNTFYNREDEWAIPVVGQKRMEPYYTVMKLPGEKKEEFILMLPFTPRRKDNLAAWMVARSDGDHLGKLVLYTFPKQKLVFGPKQIVARINQDSEVSQQITLWDQSGSNVIRGTLLVIPIEDSLLYIQPLYLRAEDGRIPELKRVIVGYQNEIAMGLDLDDALKQIFGGSDTSNLLKTVGTEGAQNFQADSTGSAAAIIKQRQEVIQQALRQQQAINEAGRQGNWGKFGEALDKLGQTLKQLQNLQ